MGLSLAKPLIIAVAVGGIALAGYVKGHKDVRALWDIEIAAHQVAAAQAAAREAGSLTMTDDDEVVRYQTMLEIRYAQRYGLRQARFFGRLWSSKRWSAAYSWG